MFATNPITPIRFLGGLFAVALLIESARRYRRRDITRLSMLLTWLVSTGIIVLAIDPSLWREAARRDYPAGPQDEASFTITTYIRQHAA